MPVYDDRATRTAISGQPEPRRRGPVLTLVGAIDGATGRVPAATFRGQEDAAGYLEGLEILCAVAGVEPFGRPPGGATIASTASTFESGSR